MDDIRRENIPDATTQELYDEAMELLDGQVKAAHITFDAIAEGSPIRPQRTRKRKRRTPRQMGYTAT